MSTAHKGAWDAGILHRDISANNIMRVVDQDAEDPDRMEVDGIHAMVEGVKAHGVSITDPLSSRFITDSRFLRS